MKNELEQWDFKGFFSKSYLLSKVQHEALMSNPLAVDQFADQIRNFFRWPGRILNEMKKKR